MRRPLAHVAALLVGAALLVSCGGGSGGGPGIPAPSQLAYGTNPALYRMGEAVASNAPTVTGDVDSFAIVPDLPLGLVFDVDTGEISGLPAAEAATADYTVTATGPGGSTNATLALGVGPALPTAIASLPLGFLADVVVEGGPQKIGKVVPAPDGRLFFTEVDTGLVRIVDAGGTLLGDPFATIAVATGGHRGLLGLALDPQFATNGHVYVTACIAGDGMSIPDHQELLRFTDVDDLGTNRVVVWDDLPISPVGNPMVANINNGGELAFGLDGTLFVSLGDVGVSANAQADSTTSLAGKILRILPTVPATFPLDNPTPGDPEWCRGIRNTFALAVHPTTGGLFGADNGPNSDDELNFLQGGKNFEWGSMGGIPGAQLGFKMQNYGTVVVPTGLAWHDGTGWGAAFADSLFMATYDDYTVRRFVLSGAAFTDIDDEEAFATLDGSSGQDANRPLDVAFDSATGDLYVSTFNGIYRIRRHP